MASSTKAVVTSGADDLVLPADPPECGSINTAIEAVRRLFVDHVQYNHTVNDNPPPKLAKRAAFIKQHGGAYATFQVVDDLPPQYCVGIFQQAAHYDAWVRFSSDTAQANSDMHTTVGVGIKIFGITGPKVLEEDAQTTTLDLVLQNTPQFFAADAMEMCSFKYAVVNFTPAQFALWRAAHPTTDQVLKDMQKLVPSMLTEKLWSCVPYKFGKDASGHDAYCKYILSNPKGSGGTAPDGSDPNYLSTDLQARLKVAPYQLDFYVQLRNDPDSQSLIDATEVWNESEAKPVKVATLLIPQQDITVRGQAEYSEVLSYSIWRTLPEMAPVGSISEVRKVVYQASAQHRRNVNGQPIGEPAEPRRPGPPTPPFALGDTWNNAQTGMDAPLTPP